MKASQGFKSRELEHTMGQKQPQKYKGSSQGPFCIWQGMDFPNWVRMLRTGPPLHWSQSLRLALVTGLSINNSIMGLAERLIYGGRVRRQELVAPPVFILGHWRSGTTLLHNLMSLDPQFTTSNLYEVLAPHHFLLTEAVTTRLTAAFLPKTRPMDNMEISWDSPQEDETALLNLTTLSPYQMCAHHNNAEKYDRYLDFQNVTPREKEIWKKAFLTFLKKITVRDHKRILLKSPTHSFRIRILLEMFPEAKFVNIVRNPYAVYTSAVHLRKTMFSENSLSRPNFVGVEEDVFALYSRLFHTYDADKKLLHPGQLHEMKFEDLEQDPLGEMRKVYETLGLNGFPAVETAITAQLDSLRKYRKNEYDLEESLKRQIYERWRPAFERYGYPSGFLKAVG